MDKLESKIRELLGNEYHLSTEYKGEKEPIRWVLYRRYKDTDIYFSEDNKPIMSSDTHSMVELYKYAKSHQRVDGIMKTRWVICVILFINAILSFSNIYFNSKIIRTIVLVNDFDFLLIYAVLFYFWHKNNKVDMLELKENLIKRMRNK